MSRMRATFVRYASKYTVMLTRIPSFFTPHELSTAELVAPFGFTKGARLMKVKGHDNIRCTGDSDRLLPGYGYGAVRYAKAIPTSAGR